jgi:hypothetical protein
VQQRRPARRVELRAEVTHVDVDDVTRATVNLVFPDLGGDLLTGEDAAAVAHEVLEQGVLFLSQRDHVGAAGNLARQGLKRQVADPEGDVVGPERRAAQEGADAGGELLVLEGLREVVIGAGLEADDLIGHGIEGGQHEHGRAESPAAELPGDDEAAPLWEADVEDDEVGLLVEGRGQARLAVDGGAHVIAVGRERPAQDLQDFRPIFDDKNSRPFGGACFRFVPAVSHRAQTWLRVKHAASGGDSLCDLESEAAHRFYSRVQTRTRVGLVTGLVAASATAGVIEGFSRHEHFSAFAGMGRQLLAVIASATRPTPATAILVGVALHVVLALCWARLFVLVAGRLQGFALVVAAVVASAVIWAINSEWMPSVLRFGNDLTAFVPQATIFYVVLALALAAGMRFARDPGHT